MGDKRPVYKKTSAHSDLEQKPSRLEDLELAIIKTTFCARVDGHFLLLRLRSSACTPSERAVFLIPNCSI